MIEQQNQVKLTTEDLNKAGHYEDVTQPKRYNLWKLYGLKSLKLATIKTQKCPSFFLENILDYSQIF